MLESVNLVSEANAKIDVNRFHSQQERDFTCQVHSHSLISGFLFLYVLFTIYQ